MVTVILRLLPDDKSQKQNDWWHYGYNKRNIDVVIYDIDTASRLTKSGKQQTIDGMTSA